MPMCAGSHTAAAVPGWASLAPLPPLPPLPHPPRLTDRRASPGATDRRPTRSKLPAHTGL
jgi:hypothetical protein